MLKYILRQATSVLFSGGGNLMFKCLFCSVKIEKLYGVVACVSKYLGDVVVGLRLPAVHLVELDHDARPPVVHPELLRLGALHVRVVRRPLYRRHAAPAQTNIF